MNVERLLVYINPVVRYVTLCVLSYEYGMTSVGSRQPWSVDVFLCRKAVANWWSATTMKRTLLVCLRNSWTQQSHSELWIPRVASVLSRIQLVLPRGKKQGVNRTFYWEQQTATFVDDWYPHIPNIFSIPYMILLVIDYLPITHTNGLQLLYVRLVCSAKKNSDSLAVTMSVGLRLNCLP